MVFIRNGIFSVGYYGFRFFLLLYLVYFIDYVGYCLLKIFKFVIFVLYYVVCWKFLNQIGLRMVDILVFMFF